MRLAVVIIAMAALVGLGVHDAVVWTERATLAADASHQQKLDSIPMAFGDWTGETQAPDEAQTKHSAAFARVQRVYRRGGLKPAAVTVLVLTGPTTELAVHDPERCYDGVGYKPDGPREYKVVPDADLKHMLWARRFLSGAPPYGRIEVAWGWTAEGRWQASENARTEFAGRALLHKLYVSRNISPPADTKSEEPDPTVEFLAEFTPLARIAIAGANP
jgi:hypothetical protein